MIAEAVNNGRRHKTTVDLRYRLGVFGKTFGTRKLSEITLEELKAWLDNPTLSARSKIHNATKISQLYNYAIRQGWTESNLVKRITRPSVEDVAPGILTPQQAARLLEHADKHQLLPYVAIGLFAGLRSAELHRLDWSAVKLGERCIIIGAEVAKKRSRRVVEINDTLASWLAVCGKPSGQVVPLYNLNRSMHKLATAAGFAKWPHNALRHSFASYHLAKHGDATKTAFQMGNDPVVVHQSYKALVSNGDVERYWKLRPAAGADEKIVAMKAAANA
jgi:integrase